MRIENDSLQRLSCGALTCTMRFLICYNAAKWGSQEYIKDVFRTFFPKNEPFYFAKPKKSSNFVPLIWCGTSQRKVAMRKVALLMSLALAAIGCCSKCKTRQSNNQGSSCCQEAEISADKKAQICIDNILTRASVREFTGERPTDEQIETLLRAAMSAPTAMNYQPWAFIVVDDEAVLKQIGEALPYSRVQNGAKVAFVMCGDMSKAIEGDGRDFWIDDVSAATENLLLAAHAMGLGAVWTGVYPSEERSETVREILRMPKSVVPLCIVPVGTPKAQPEVKDKWKQENIHINKW